MPWTREGGWVRVRSNSSPELGKGHNPLQDYEATKLALTLDEEEEEAERLYYAAVSSSLGKKAFCILAKDLSRRSQNGGAYLTWLICRGRGWPKVHGDTS